MKASLNNLALPDQKSSVVTCSNYSQREHVNQVIAELLARDWSPLPVAPGRKNPSWISPSGKIYNLKHEPFRDRRPTDSELKKWFSHPDIGIGTNGGSWGDFDLKHFNDAEHMESIVQPIIDRAEWVERTQSGGYRVAVAPDEKPDFTIFGIGDVDKAGEFIHSGGFVVLAPTKGENGDYVRLKSGEPLKIDRAEDLGLRPTSKQSASSLEPPAATPLPEPPRLVQVQLLDLASKKIQERFSIAESGNFDGDRSREIVALAQEFYAWERLANEQGISTDSADTLINHVAEAMGIANKLQRCIKNVDRSTVKPALEHAKGIEQCITKLELKAGIKKAEAKPVADDDTIFLTPNDSPGSIAYEYLFCEGYVRIGDSFHLFSETHYQEQDDRLINAKISRLFERCVERTETDKSVVERRPYRTAAKVRDAREWCLTRIPWIPMDEVNKGGLNLLNGVLTFKFDEHGIPQEQLIPHSSDLIFTYEPRVAYHPEADDTDVLRLLQAISPSYIDAVLKVFAAAIDLEEVRRRCGHIVRSMIFTGGGRNGKDALRVCLSYLFGKDGLTACTLDDFQAYEAGRKFNLAPLAISRINWASENNASINIDKINSLKDATTGEPLVSEEKHKQGQLFTPSCITIFSTNDPVINLTASQTAIAERFVIVPFNKTFVPNPKKANELKADPRFKYDPEWVKSEVCPPLLNILIEKYKAIFSEGIDYEPFTKVMKDNTEKSNHLLQFAKDAGLEEDENGQVSIDVFWTKLTDWYKDLGILEVTENGREKWADDERPGDKYIKAKNHIGGRLRKYFPDIITGDKARIDKNTRGIKGIRFVDPVEKALLAVETWGEYCRAVELFGDSAVKAVWAKLPIEVQNKIAGLQPTVTTPEPLQETVKADEEKLTDEDILECVEMLGQAVSESAPEALETFEGFPPEHKRRIWDATPLDIKDGVNKLRELAGTKEVT